MPIFSKKCGSIFCVKDTRCIRYIRIHIRLNFLFGG